MIQQIINWRTAFALVAVGIVIGTIFYSNYLARKIAGDERRKIELWAESRTAILSSDDPAALTLAGSVGSNNTTIPVIETSETDSILDFINLDTSQAAAGRDYIQNKLISFKKNNRPIVWTNPLDSTQKNYYYYGESKLLREVRYYPLVQLLVVALFIFIIFYAITTRYRSTQNQVWAGMAKETAHQLGTPISSLQGWVEMLRETEFDEKVVGEIEKDVNRLKLVSDRFGKIGSTPQLEEKNLVPQVRQMVEYMRKRASGKVQFSLQTHGLEELPALISAPLFDWVIENLLKNALDAIEGRGSITIEIKDTASQILIDVTDSGKGISKGNISKVFKPGFTTKKRGWGLGLSLSKRIMEQYHKGQIFVKHSEPGRGTTFRVVLNKA